MTASCVLITGGVGFIGQRIAGELVAADVTVRALDLVHPQVHRDPRASIARFPGVVSVGDVRDPGAVMSAMDGCTAVVHLAAETGVGQSMYESERYTSVNVDGTRNVLNAARARALPTIVASSRAVYGPGAYDCPEHGRAPAPPCCADATPSPSREDDVIAPVSIYGQTKADAERLAGEARDTGLPVLVLRPQNVIGAGQAVHNPYTGVLAAFAARLRSGLPPQIYGTGDQTRDFIAVEDVARDVAWSLMNTEVWPRYPVLNVGSGVRVTLRELALTACRAADAPAELEFIAVTRPGDIDHACADVTRRTAAGLPSAQVSLLDSVSAFMRFAESEDPVDPAIWDVALEQITAAERGD